MCSNLLGVGSGRRLLGSNEGPFALKVNWDDTSFVNNIKEIKKEQKQERLLAEMQAIREALGIPLLPPGPLPARPPTRPPTVIATPRPITYRVAFGCGDSSCETDETDKSCPNDCIDAQLDTTSHDQSMASSAESINFTIKAKRAVAIKSLSFYTSISARNSEVTVKTLEGQYSQGIFSDSTADEWETVFHGRVFTRGYDSKDAQLTTVTFDQDVVVPTGKAQSFEVHTAAPSHIMVQLGEQEGMLAGQDMALEVRVGRSGAQSPAAFGGIIEYDGLDDGSNAGGRSKSAKAKTAKLEKDDVVLETGTDEVFLQAESDREEETITLDPVRAVVKKALDDKMGALEEDVHSIKADVKTTNDKIEALEEDVQSIKSMMTHIVKLLEASGDAEEDAGNGTTN